MFKKLVLHVGCEKTATTAMQKALAGSRAKLKKNGFLYPRSLGHQNHTRLVAAVQDDGVLDNIRAHILAKEAISTAGLRRKLAHEFKSEVLAAKKCHTLIVSSELIHSRVHTDSEIDRLLAFFAPYVETIEVVLYLRPQVELAISRFSSLLRSGYSEFDKIFEPKEEIHYKKWPKNRQVDAHEQFYDFQALIKRFERRVPREQIKLVLYPDLSAVDHALRRFSELAGFDVSLLTVPKEPLNPAMSAQAQFVIAEVNKRVRRVYSSGLRRDDVKDLYDCIESAMPGELRMVSRLQAETFMQSFEASNQWVCDHYFPSRETLFDMDYPRHPETVDYSHLSSVLAAPLKGVLGRARRLRGSESATSRGKRMVQKVRRVFQ